MYRNFTVLLLLILTLSGCSDFAESDIKDVKILDLKSSSKHLLFYGSRHCNDKSDPMFKDIEERLSMSNPQIVLVEGYSNKSRYESAYEAILNGESSFVSFLAETNKIPLDTVEPSKEDQYKSLLSKCDKEKVLSMNR